MFACSYGAQVEFSEKKGKKSRDTVPLSTLMQKKMNGHQNRRETRSEKTTFFDKITAQLLCVPKQIRCFNHNIVEEDWNPQNKQTNSLENKYSHPHCVKKRIYNSLLNDELPDGWSSFRIISNLVLTRLVDPE